MQPTKGGGAHVALAQVSKAPVVLNGLQDRIVGVPGCISGCARDDRADEGSVNLQKKCFDPMNPFVLLILAVLGDLGC